MFIYIVDALSFFFFFSSRRRHTRLQGDWSSDVCSSDLSASSGPLARPKVLHDAKGPELALAAHGWVLAGVVSDTALTAYLARPDQRSYDLADLTLAYLKRELKAGAGEDDGQLSFDSVGDETAG